MQRSFFIWVVSLLFIVGCGDATTPEEQTSQSDSLVNAQKISTDKSVRLIDSPTKVRPPVTCQAYWEGAHLEDGQCVESGTSGCSNPFPYADLGECCAANLGAGGCDDHPPVTCQAYWEGAVYEDGACVERGTSGCSNPFPYADLGECCADHADATGCGPSDGAERARCEEAGGQWHLFPNTCAGTCGPSDRMCGQALTWGCLCAGDSCWNGDSCVGFGQDPGHGCQDDADCDQGYVCEPGTGNGPLQCVRGCHADADCSADQYCDTRIQCVTTPCPGQCSTR